MFLRSLSMRGFKSFADRTALEVEPGITVIVGPNGSGKSNVVDALAWVLGTHSAKKVRGASMSDVIFAGSPSRNRGSHARVEITIDNADGRLERAGIGTAESAGAFSEITIARTIHAEGDTSYQINGEEVRALDVQELLSDTGLGRELHTIVGQGQLDEILNAKPEERRRYIEEAAGILKHRRRRERALRKLEQVDAHVDKLQTVLRELRRQLRPLERQAEAADRYRALQSELRAVRIRIAAGELARLERLAATEGRDGDAAAAEQQALEQRLSGTRERIEDLERHLAQLRPAAERAGDGYHRLTSLAERLRGTSDLVEAKRRHLVEAVEEPLAGRPPAELRAQADRIAQQARERAAQRDRERDAHAEAQQRRRAAEQSRRAHEQALQAEQRRRAEARERVLRWEGEVSALRGSIAGAESEIGRVGAALEGLDARVREAAHEVAKVEGEIRTLDTDEVALTEALEDAEAAVAAERERVEALAAQARELEGMQTSKLARAEALRAALEEADGGTGALLEAGLDGVLGPVADHVRVEGDEVAVAAAIGQLGDAVVVRTQEHARRAIAWLRDTRAGAAAVLVGRVDDRPVVAVDDAARERLQTAGASPLGAALGPADDDEVSGQVVRALQQALEGTYLVGDWSTAVLLHGRDPQLTFVTPEGDLAGPRGYLAAGAPERSSVVTATAADDAEREASELGGQLSVLAEQRAAADAALARAEEVLAEATQRINESDARITGAAERLARLNRELHSLAEQREVVAAQHHELEQVLEGDRQALSELHSRGPQQPEEEPEPGPDATAVELDEAVELAREAELDARLTLERSVEQVRHLEEQAAGLRQEADEVEAALAEAARRREARRRGIERCGELAVVVRTALERIEGSLAAAAAERDRLHAEVRSVGTALSTAREESGTLQQQLAELTQRRHAADLRRQDVTTRLDHLITRIRTELSLRPEEVRAEHPDATGDDHDELTAREDELVRKVGLLGRVNPLALEEFRALEERHAFLSDQLDDLRRSKRDLQEVVIAVDERIREVFRTAFEDVAREFELTFSTVFPGGHGRLVLTEPDELLTTGIEVEARPPGKKVTRLSLLSGGERSLTVLAFVFAIFRARPSPFYVLDEVDAALDDVNLQRLLKVIRSFRGHAQIIMVTHQKRSMEIADMLYGVTMGPDAVTKVVAERLRSGENPSDDLEDRASDDPTAAVLEEASTTA